MNPDPSLPQFSPPALPSPPRPGAPLRPSPAVRALPAQPSLEQLRKQAKDLLAAARRGDRAARGRLEAYFPVPRPGPSSAGEPPRPTLAQAQLVVAREHGCPSWTRLRREVRLTPLRAQLERFAERPVHWPVRRDAMQALVQAGPDGLEVVLEGLAHPDPAVRRGAVGFLDHHATDACVPQLLELSRRDPAPDVRRSALHTLTCADCKETPLQLDALPLLVRAFRDDPNRRVRATAAGALFLSGHASLDQVQEAFRAAVREDESGLVRRVALDHLRGDDALSVVEHAARHDPDPLVRAGAAVRLGREPGYHQVACRVLEQVLREDVTGKVRREAHLALKRLSPEYRQRAAQQAREAHLALASATPRLA